VVEDEVITRRLTPWFGDIESALGGAGQKAGFHPLSTNLVMLDKAFLTPHWFGPKKEKRDPEAAPIFDLINLL